MNNKISGKGSQKKARFERLKNEIIKFVSANHGLTPRKVGFFISRNLGEKLTWWQDHKAGRRVYGDKSQLPNNR